MKILFVTDLYPIGDEKIAKALFYFVREWQKQGHFVEVIRSNFIFNTLIRGRKIIKEKEYFENNTKIYNLNFHTPFWFNVNNKLPKDFSLKNYDVIISHMPSGALMAQKLLKRKDAENLKYVCAVHNSDITVLKDLKYSLFFGQRLKNAYKRADKISARSPILKEKIEKILPFSKGKTFTAYSGLDDNLINNKGGYKPFNPADITISTACSLIKRKNIDILIKAMAELKEYNIKLKIIGEGREEKHLKNLADKLQINDRITFLGRLSRIKVMEELKKSDIFALISDNETFGLVYLEALSAGNIVICKKGDGIDGILKDKENSFLINPDKKELKECIKNIILMPNEETALIKSNAQKTLEGLKLSDSAENYIKNIL